MGMPSKLKAFNVFNDGNNYQGQAAEVVLPKLTKKMEEWRGSGMNGPIKYDMGQEAIVLEWTIGGMIRGVLDQWGITTHNGLMVRFAGGYANPDTGAVDAVEVVVRGRHSEIDMGTAKSGEDTAIKIVTECSYYKLTINGQDVIEIDMLGMVEKVNGTDRLADLRQAIGL